MTRTKMECAPNPLASSSCSHPVCYHALRRAVVRAPPNLTPSAPVKALSADEIGPSEGAESLGWETHPPHVTMHAEL